MKSCSWGWPLNMLHVHDHTCACMKYFEWYHCIAGNFLDKCLVIYGPVKITHACMDVDCHAPFCSYTLHLHRRLLDIIGNSNLHVELLCMHGAILYSRGNRGASTYVMHATLAWMGYAWDLFMIILLLQGTMLILGSIIVTVRNIRFCCIMTLSQRSPLWHYYG